MHKVGLMLAFTILLIRLAPLPLGCLYLVVMCRLTLKFRDQAFKQTEA